MSTDSVVVIAGVGPGSGAALVQRFADGGYRVAMLARRSETLDELEQSIPGAKGFVCDITDEASVIRIFDAIRNEMGEITTLVFNAGTGIFAGIEEITPLQFEIAWRVNAMGALLCSRQVIPRMKSQHSGSIIFIGATASRRGGPMTAAFAPAKAAQASLAESMARSLWPAGIHVALIVVDGFIATPGIRAMMPEKSDDFFIRPNALAETAWQLAHQDKSSWSFEVDARPFAELW